MSRTPKRKSPAEGESNGEFRMMGQVMLLDISDETSCKPPSDVHETPDAVIIRMEVPGVPADSLAVLVRGASIEIFAEKRPDMASEDASYLCLERSFGRFHRAFDVSGPVNLSRMVVTLKRGVLALHIPKILERRGRERRVPILTEEE
ncbi:MAG: Hsp20/alpha crystallin family protein [Deltaproteobacteria bacterium]|nr:Hsp20/alpha crystallin family protein [Deltaproteobacteria bacterium]